MKNSIIKKLLLFVPILFVIVLLAAFLYSIYYIDRLEEQIYERDKTIQELTFMSDLVEEFFDIEYDSITHTTSYTLKSSKKNYIIPQQDSTQQMFTQGDKLLSANEVVDEYNILLGQYNELADEYNALVRNYNESSKKYKKIVKEYNVAYNDKMRQIQELKAVLGRIEKSYDIQYVITRDSTTSAIVLTNTERIDSALMLLPFYRDKLKKVSDDTWTIEHY